MWWGWCLVNSSSFSLNSLVSWLKCLPSKVYSLNYLAILSVFFCLVRLYHFSCICNFFSSSHQELAVSFHFHFHHFLALFRSLQWFCNLVNCISYFPFWDFSDMCFNFSFPYGFSVARRRNLFFYLQSNICQVWISTF